MPSAFFQHGFYKALHGLKQIGSEELLLQSLNVQPDVLYYCSVCRSFSIKVPDGVKAAGTSITASICLYSLWSICHYEASLTWIKRVLVWNVWLLESVHWEFFKMEWNRNETRSNCASQVQQSNIQRHISQRLDDNKNQTPHCFYRLVFYKQY